MLTAVGRLLDVEIERVRSAIFQSEFIDEDLKLPEAEGNTVQLSEKIFVPIKEYPDVSCTVHFLHLLRASFASLHFQYNFVGRILGPRGMTAKQLEKKTGCKIMIRGKSSIRDDTKVSSSFKRLLSQPFTSLSGHRTSLERRIRSPQGGASRAGSV